VERTIRPEDTDLWLAGIFRGQPCREGAAGGTAPRFPSDPTEAADDAALGASLRALFEEGARAWPGVEITPEAFVRYLAERAGPTGALPSGRASDVYLACACVARARGALEAFDRAHLRLVGAYLARMRPSATFVDDVRQTLREKLFVGRTGSPPKIAEYDGRGALASWMRVITLRAAIDLRRRTSDVVEEPAGREELGTSDPEIGYLKQRYREAFNAAFREAVAALDADKRALLQRHYVEGHTLEQLAADEGVHRATVARRIASARTAVTEEALRRLRAALGANASELESLAGVMRSQLDLSLRWLYPGDEAT
jgi:RNA polymerase sigma-70 factor, ECF subfamily